MKHIRGFLARVFLGISLGISFMRFLWAFGLIPLAEVFLPKT